MNVDNVVLKKAQKSENVLEFISFKENVNIGN